MHTNQNPHQMPQCLDSSAIPVACTDCFFRVFSWQSVSVHSLHSLGLLVACFFYNELLFMSPFSNPSLKNIRIWSPISLNSLFISRRTPNCSPICHYRASTRTMCNFSLPLKASERISQEQNVDTKHWIRRDMFFSLRKWRARTMINDKTVTPREIFLLLTSSSVLLNCQSHFVRLLFSSEDVCIMIKQKEIRISLGDILVYKLTVSWFNYSRSTLHGKTIF